MRRTRQEQRGYSLPIVLISLSLLAIAASVLFAVLGTGARSTGAMINRRESFYACDGMGRIVTKLSQDYMSTTPSPTATSMKTYICDEGGSPECTTLPVLPAITPPGFEVESFELTSVGAVTAGPLENGPFRGMNANRSPIEFKLKARQAATGVRCAQDNEVVLAKIALFQFFIFADGDMDWVPGPFSEVRGRVHANGNWCLGGSSGLHVERVTAAGGLYNIGSGAPCTFRAADFNVKIGSNGPADYLPFTPDNDHGCVNCGGTGLPWREYALDTWNGQAADSDHNVPMLRMPISGSAQVQAGVDAVGGTLSNVGNLRFLVDPVRSVDSGDVKEQKFACKADLRIIDGVWYLKTATSADPCGWPGKPIWSDHPGHWTPGSVLETEEVALVGGGKAVGQAQLFGDTALGWAGRPAPFVPRRYSYYATEPQGANIGKMVYAAGDPAPVISYGTLFRAATTPPTWRPGHWSTNSNPAICTTNDINNVLDATTTAGCGGTPVQARLLNGTRSGFVDPQPIRESGDTSTTAESNFTAGGNLSRVLPINFDVAAFKAALVDTSPGELGALFCNPGEGCLANRKFNGIVFITTTWERSLDGFGDPQPIAGGPTKFVLQGAGYTGLPLQNVGPAIAATNFQQQDLPYPLCSDATAGAALGTTSGDGSPTFFVDTIATIPACNQYQRRGARPQAVRVINASNTGDNLAVGDPLPKGISIVTPLPLYQMGEVNTHSVPAGTAADPWVPALLAGDHVKLLSNAWDDSRVPWLNPVGISRHPGEDSTSPRRTRFATSTTYNFQMLSGQPPSTLTKYSGGVENFPGLLESWTGQTATINGSLVRGYTPVYHRWIQQGYKQPPQRPWAFDTHLNALANQPPGSPTFDVQATRSWSRD